MKRYAIVLAALLSSALSISVHAGPNLNDAQRCLAAATFLNDRVEKAADVYPAADMKIVSKGIEQYYHFMNDEMMPKFIQYKSKGNKDISDKIQEQNKQVIEYSLTQGNQVYSDNLLREQFAQSIIGCVKKGLASQDEAANDNLANSLLKIIELAKKN